MSENPSSNASKDTSTMPMEDVVADLTAMRIEIVDALNATFGPQPWVPSQAPTR